MKYIITEKECNVNVAIKSLLQELLKMKLSSGKLQFYEKAPCWCQNILTLAHIGILHSSMQEISSDLWSKNFYVLLQDNSGKSLISKMLGKMPEIHGMGREDQI
jgi:hypothetical protein